MKAFLFNPENDLALASGEANYTAPRNAALLHDCGAMLPMWYASAGDYVLTRNVDCRWMERMCSLFNLSINASDSLPADIECCPWGWSANAVMQFRRAGVGTDALPSDNAIEQMRRLSHRRTCLEVYKRLAGTRFGYLELPVEASSVETVESYAKSHSMKFYYKAPWSSTGRGVASSEGVRLQEILRRCSGIINRQGSVMLEPLLEKVFDFAMLFYAADDGSVVFAGFSMFNNSGTAYAGNILLSDNEIRLKIAGYTGEHDVDVLVSDLPDILGEVVAGAYHGYFGVDMMVYFDSSAGKYFIAPCVEVNLRMTMGVVAHIWRERYLSPDAGRAVLSVCYHSLENQCSAVVENGKLVSGEVNLVPPGGVFGINVKVEC